MNRRSTCAWLAGATKGTGRRENVCRNATGSSFSVYENESVVHRMAECRRLRLVQDLALALDACYGNTGPLRRLQRTMAATGTTVSLAEAQERALTVAAAQRSKLRGARHARHPESEAAISRVPFSDRLGREPQTNTPTTTEALRRTSRKPAPRLVLRAMQPTLARSTTENAS
jgi:hypothetical protein